MYKKTEKYLSEEAYYKLYLKYKNKYINLKMNQFGGSRDTTDDMNEFLPPIIGIPYKSTKTTYDNIHIIKIVLNDDNKPPLVVVPGMSHKSFVGTSTIILNKLEVLTEKFSSIYLVEYDSFKSKQKEACDMRDILKTKGGDIYKPELEMNSEIAEHIHDIITRLDLKNVHLLGKCNGAWIVTLLLMKSPIYVGLYLAVPGIPYNINVLTQLGDRLKKINFVFGWVQQDGYMFDWGRKSFEEKEIYDETMKHIEEKYKIKLLYKSIMYDNGEEEHIKIYHEIDPRMIDDIILSIL